MLCLDRCVLPCTKNICSTIFQNTCIIIMDVNVKKIIYDYHQHILRRHRYRIMYIYICICIHIHTNILYIYESKYKRQNSQDSLHPHHTELSSFAPFQSKYRTVIILLKKTFMSKLDICIYCKATSFKYHKS